MSTIDSCNDGFVVAGYVVFSAICRHPKATIEVQSWWSVGMLLQCVIGSCCIAADFCLRYNHFGGLFFFSSWFVFDVYVCWFCFRFFLFFLSMLSFAVGWSGE